MDNSRLKYKKKHLIVFLGEYKIFGGYPPMDAYNKHWRINLNFSFSWALLHGDLLPRTTIASR